ncbi:MAG TPA: peptidoglycan editing factor PgeF [Polyangiaceae bacterium]|nr:peptidoglycan editing factor PgeF [Polyangiaceae bacterium]
MQSAEYLRSPLLAREGFVHAFFTRNGGVSQVPFASLSFSVAVGDREAAVAENLRRAALALGISCASLYFVSQVHGTATQVADGSEAREEFVLREGDAVLSVGSGVGCAVRSADCVPILIADRRSGAVAAIHAGWRGVEQNVVRASLQRLRALLGSPGELIAAIGPHIGPAAFEVSAEVAERLRLASSQHDVVDASRAKPHVDLRRIVRAQLADEGLEDGAIDDVPGCTFGDAGRFFSFRRDGQRSGRHLSAIVASPR